VNPWALLAVVLAWGGSVGYAYIHGRQSGQDACIAESVRDEAVAAIASEAAASAAAQAISRIEVRNVTVNKALEREVQTREVFRECRSGADAVRLLNSTPGIHAAPRAESAASGIVPSADGPGG
jgi:hypothetical protein